MYLEGGADGSAAGTALERALQQLAAVGGENMSSRLNVSLTCSMYCDLRYNLLVVDNICCLLRAINYSCWKLFVRPSLQPIDLLLLAVVHCNLLIVFTGMLLCDLRYNLVSFTLR